MASEPPDPVEDDILDVVPSVAADSIRPVERGFTDVQPLLLPYFEHPPRLPSPPPSAQPGFWFGVLATFLMFVVCQIAIPVGVVIIYMAVKSVESAAGKGVLENLNTTEGMKQFQSETAMPLLVSAHVPMIFFSLIALRLVAGRNWWREIAIRLPSFTHLVLLVLGFPALPILAGGAYLLAQMFIPGLAKTPALLFSQIAVIAVFCAVWLVGLTLRNHDPKEDLVRSPLRWQLLVGYGVLILGIGAAIASYQLVAPYSPALPAAFADMDKGMEDLVKDTRNWSLPLAVLVIAVMPAFSEELWCRAFLGRGFVGQYGVVLGVMITSYFFGAIHILPHQGVMAMLMGLVLHYAYLTTRSLLAPMLLHFLNNATSVLGGVLPDAAANVDTAPDEIPLVIFASAFLLLIAVGVALYQSRARLVRVEGPPDLPPWQPPYPGVALPPPGSGTVISHPWPHLALVGLVVAAFGAFATLFALSTYGVHLP